MAVDTANPRSRRTLLAAALGGVGALAASALGRATPVLAADGDTVKVGQSFSGTSPTKILNTTNVQTVIWGVSILGTGVGGTSDSGAGVSASSNSGWGVIGHSPTGWGVLGSTDTGYAVRGTSNATNRPAITGESSGNNTGVFGFSGAGATPAAKAKTGVYGQATQDANSRGVWGRANMGRGVLG